MPRILSRGVVMLILLALVGVLSHVARNSQAAASPEQAKHGLTGSYYIGTGQWDKDTPPTATFSVVQIWSDANDFNLPRTFTAPAATRVDGQIAFGQGKGFQAKGGSAPTMWWPTGFPAPAGWRPVAPTDKPWDNLATVIWKGYIHLPKAGTYYFGTISNGPSAVYLNQARVALNGLFGGALVSDAFSYAKEDVQEFVQNFFSGREDIALGSRPRETYVVPVSIDAPRDLPIEVQYNPSQHFSHLASEPFGIDLFWVTPDSPHDANGKPIAKIVPSEVLHAEPPSTIEKPTVRSVNSTVEADHLYFPTGYAGESVTVTIRLADKDGNPVAGKRVYVSSLTSYGNSDAITQPEKPTDKNGETTAKIRANATYAVGHDSAIFATDATDLVDVAQVAHVTFQQVDWNFFTDAFSPYYDRRFSVTPRPPVVGQPATLKTELKNHSKFPASVTVIFLTTDWNIGFTNFEEIARVKDITLQPGESKVVGTTFTPKEVMSHKCYRVEVRGHYMAMNASRGAVFAAALLPPMTPENNTPSNSSGVCFGTKVGESCWGVQINTSAVALPPCGQPEFGGKLGAHVPTHTEPCKPNDAEKKYCDAQLGHVRQQITYFEQDEAKDVASGNWTDARRDVEAIYQLQAREKALDSCAKDPLNAAYQRLAVAAADTPAAYLAAATKSWERYQGAEAEGDRKWMAQHFTADKLYLKRFAEAMRRAADEAQKQAESLPSDDPETLAKSQAARDQFLDRWRHGQRLSPDQAASLKQAGVSEQQATAVIDTLAAAKEIPPVKSARTLLLETAAQYRKSAEDAEQIANSAINTSREGARGQPLAQFFMVANPHDQEENVDLFIRPTSIPPDWKLSVVNAEQMEGNTPAGKPDEAPKFAVRETEPGKHYVVTLPAKAQVKVASVLVPVGEIGARTTASWAVEGKIGNELIGGMVHEMNVPYIVADLKLPPVGSKEEEEELPAPSKAWMRIGAEIAAGIVIVVLLVYFSIFWRRRRRAGTSSAV